MTHAHRIITRTRAALHELRCTECRVAWAGWAARLTGLDYWRARHSRQRAQANAT